MVILAVGEFITRPSNAYVIKTYDLINAYVLVVKGMSTSHLRTHFTDALAFSFLLGYTTH